MAQATRADSPTKTCTADECDKPLRARGLCSTHYNQAHFADRPHNKKVLIPCATCEVLCEKIVTRTLTARFCSWDCRTEWARENLKGAYNPDRKPRRLTEKQQVRKLREAIRNQDYPTILQLVELRADTSTECWVWPSLDRDGYATSGFHRVVMEAVQGQPLGKQPVHHRCANRGCVRPEHLQLVTAYDNAAEMLARRYMESRIADLEQALTLLAPNHPLLKQA